MLITQDPDIRLFIRHIPGFGFGQLAFHLLVREPLFGPISKEYGPKPLGMAPGVYSDGLKDRLTALWRFVSLNPSDGEIALRKIESIGTTLFRELPEALQTRLCALLGRAATIQIVSNELEIPWELMKLQDRAPGSWDGPFLCEAFAVTRWLPDISGSLRLPIRNIALVVPNDSGLAEAPTERYDMLSLVGPDRQVSEIEPVYRTLIDVLRTGEHDAWHFCGHGTTKPSDPNHTSFLLDRDGSLRPDDLNQHGESLARHQPLVFLNACDTAQGGYSLMSLGGWAPSFLGAGAGAFLGALWPVDDHVAREFAKAFYRRFLGGEPIAEALRQARLHVRDLHRGDPSWLAYTAFAHPFATTQAERPVSPPEKQKQRRQKRSRIPATSASSSVSGSPDLEIHVDVSFQNGMTRLDYRLNSPSGILDFYHQGFEGPKLEGSPDDYRVGLLEIISKLNQGFDAEGEILLQDEVRRELEGIGRRLYHELFPPELRSAYRTIRKRGLSLMFITNEPWIPWELLKPYDDSNMSEIIDDDFLCLRFPMTRWLSAAGPPAERIQVRRFAFLGDRVFPRLQLENEQLIALGKYAGVEDMSPEDATLSAFEGLLDTGGAELLHFGGPFAERGLRPEDLHGPRATRIRRDRPLVFFNFRGERYGWESRWVRQCGCGAFLGPSWSIKDSLAYEFAATFYSVVGRGETFGRAVQEARKRLYALMPGVPAWLAYTFYAHVNGRLILGESNTGKEL